MKQALIRVNEIPQTGAVTAELRIVADRRPRVAEAPGVLLSLHAPGTDGVRNMANGRIGSDRLIRPDPCTIRSKQMTVYGYVTLGGY
jgi:hypothetical protein